MDAYQALRDASIETLEIGFADPNNSRAVMTNYFLEAIRRAREADALRAELSEGKAVNRLISDRLQRARDMLATLTTKTDKADLRRQIDDKRIRGLLGLRTAASVDDVCAAIERLTVKSDYTDRVSVGDVEALRAERDELRKKLDEYTDLMDMHPGACCGQCAGRIKDAEKERDEARATKDLHKERADAADAECEDLRNQLAGAEIACGQLREALAKSEAEVAGFMRAERRDEAWFKSARNTSHFIDIHVRYDGKNYLVDGAFLKHWLPDAPQDAPDQTKEHDTKHDGSCEDWCRECAQRRNDTQSEPAPDRLAEETKQTGLRVRSVEFADHAISDRAMELVTSKIKMAEAVDELERWRVLCEHTETGRTNYIPNAPTPEAWNEQVGRLTMDAQKRLAEVERKINNLTETAGDHTSLIVGTRKRLGDAEEQVAEVERRVAAQETRAIAFDNHVRALTGEIKQYIYRQTMDEGLQNERLAALEREVKHGI